ncbi:hypothetical protein [Candidatus Methanoplasma termitum]|uniref:hypothetical protein n=1 Tax=Candidatus Methanoplasma termitum TaxID=1577791 RepID=UPI000ACC3DA9|nr:hypothetical protein [Candidatus Methanoplasma termitum]MCL2333292.1 hypothetical protein [Candidatus Methanoplasma sp.]
MGGEELAANLFRITQTEGKLKRDRIDNAEDANITNHIVGSEVREAIKRMGGTMPEDLPTPSKSISEVECEQIEKLKKNKRNR